MKKGVSLILLIIIVIIMIILASAVILTTVNSNVIENAKNTPGEVNRKALEDEIITVHDIGYYSKTYGESLSNDTIDELADLVEATGVAVEKFTIYYDLHDQTDYIFYRLDKVTADEARKIETITCEKTGRPYVYLIGDADLNGVITSNDTLLISKIGIYLDAPNSLEKYIADLSPSIRWYSDGCIIRIDLSDTSNSSQLVSGSNSIKYWIEMMYTHPSIPVSGFNDHSGTTYFNNEWQT